MKKMLLLLLVAPVFSFSQTLTGVWGLKFDMTKDEVKAVLKEKNLDAKATEKETSI